MFDLAFLKEICSRHALGLIFAIIVGATMVAPQIYFATHEPAYAGVPMMGSDAEPFYVARIAQMYGDYASIDSTFLQSYSGPYLVPGLAEGVLATIGYGLHIAAPQLNVIGKFVLPCIIFLLLYALGYVVSQSRAAAVCGALISMLGENLLSGPSEWLALLHRTSTQISFLMYARPINPEVNAILLFGALYVLYASFFAHQNPGWLKVLVVGASTGALLYISPYPSSFLFGVILLSGMWFWYQGQILLARWCAAAFGIACLTVIPFLLNYVALIHQPLYEESSLRTGLIATHAPILSAWIIILLVLVLFFWPRRYTLARPFFTICFLAIFILLNQQVITGHTIQPSHFHWYITQPLLGLVLGMYGVWLVECFVEKRSWRIVVYSIVIAVVCYDAALVQQHSYEINYEEAALAQTYAPLFSYIHSLPNKEVIWADPTLSLYLPIYTDADVPNNHYLIYYLVPTNYLLEGLLLEYKLRGITPANALATMQAERADISLRLFGLYYRDQFGGYESIPDSLLAAYASDYTYVYAESYTQIFKDLGITILAMDTQSTPQWNVNVISSLHKIFSAGPITLYRVQ